MSTRRVLSLPGDVALQLLRLAAKTAEVFPPLKSVAEDVLDIAEIVKDFQSNKEEWEEFSIYVQNAIASVVESLSRIEPSQIDLNDKLNKLQSTMKDVTQSIKKKQGRSTYKRMYMFLKDPDMIARMRKKLDDAVGLFTLGSIIVTEINVEKTLDAVKANTKLLSGIAQDAADSAKNTTTLVDQAAFISGKVSKIALNAMLSKISHVQDASWDPNRTCLQGTRVNVMNDVFAWVDRASGKRGAQIYLLTAVAGAGKSTIAHSVAQHFDQERQLVSSFFFDRGANDRSTPIALFSTIAIDLARVSPQLQSQITEAIEEEPGILQAPLSRQFQKLVLEPCQKCPVVGPLVIVIDALDEAYNKALDKGHIDALIKILSDDMENLPSALSFFVTSRMHSRLDLLCRKLHVRRVELDIDDKESQEDISKFISREIQKLIEARNLGSDWPGERLRTVFEKRAGGLFLWVATVCLILLKRSEPTLELQEILSDARLDNNSTNSQMDTLYARILESCDWNDKGFVKGYHRIMGTAIATKNPLTISAQNALFHEERPVSDFVLDTLSPLLTGMSTDRHQNQPVRVLHQSLRDFLVVRAINSPDYAKFQIDEQRHSQDLALLCLRLLNRDLHESMACVGYLAKDGSEFPGIPTMRKDEISEALGYACQFWMDHLLDVKGVASIELVQALETFMKKTAVMWMEALASTGGLRGLSEVREWMKISLETTKRVTLEESNEVHAEAFQSMSSRLAYEDRKEDALASMQESLVLYRQLEHEHPGAFTPRLAKSLNEISVRLSDLGFREDALKSTYEAVGLYRQLATSSAEEFTPDLAMSLNNLSSDLSDLGHREEALTAIQEAVELYRQLAKDRPAAFTPDLAMSLNNLSAFLSGLGHREEALTAIQEAVELRRQLAKDRPAAFTPDLAMSLNNLSSFLSDLGHREEALTAIQEAVELYRQLAKDRPAAFTPVLANSLNNLSLRLSDLGHREEALTAIQEAVELYRQLAKDRPAAFTPDLAMSLNNLSLCLSGLGHREEALTTIQEAVELRRQLAKDRPAAFTPDLAQSLNNLSGRLSDLGHREVALTAIQEAVELRRQLAKDRPAAFTPVLANSLNNLSVLLSDLGHREEALTAIQEAVELRRQLAKDRPAAFTPDLAMSLYNLSLYLSNSGRREDALSAMQESTVLYRHLANDRPTVFAGDLTDCLDRLIEYYEASGQDEEAQGAKQEADEIRRSRAAHAD